MSTLVLSKLLWMCLGELNRYDSNANHAIEFIPWWSRLVVWPKLKILCILKENYCSM